jgi:hypothetical protein
MGNRREREKREREARKVEEGGERGTGSSDGKERSQSLTLLHQTNHSLSKKKEKRIWQLKHVIVSEPDEATESGKRILFSFFLEGNASFDEAKSDSDFSPCRQRSRFRREEGGNASASVVVQFERGPGGHVSGC